MILLAWVGFKYVVLVSVYFQVPHDFQFSLYELDWIVFSRHMRGAVNLIPVFETAGIKGTVCGPESFTPDHKPILGQYTFGLGAHWDTGDTWCSSRHGRFLCLWSWIWGIAHSGIGQRSADTGLFSVCVILCLRCSFMLLLGMRMCFPWISSWLHCSDGSAWGTKEFFTIPDHDYVKAKLKDDNWDGIAKELISKDAK